MLHKTWKDGARFECTRHIQIHTHSKNAWLITWLTVTTELRKIDHTDTVSTITLQLEIQKQLEIEYHMNLESMFPSLKSRIQTGNSYNLY